MTEIEKKIVNMKADANVLIGLLREFTMHAAQRMRGCSCEICERIEEHADSMSQRLSGLIDDCHIILER